MSGSIIADTASPVPVDLPALLSTSSQAASSATTFIAPSAAPAAAGLGGAIGTAPSAAPAAGSGGFTQQLSSAIQALLVQFQGGASAFVASTRAGSTTDAATPVAATTGGGGSDSAPPQNPLLNVLHEVEQAIAGAAGPTVTSGVIGASATGAADLPVTGATVTDAAPVSLFGTAFQHLAYIAAQAVRAYSNASSLAASAPRVAGYA